MHGPISGTPVGTYFANRLEAHHAGIHRHTQAGIAGYGPDGIAESIVVSGGYEDDVDSGDSILYTGEGGRNSDTGRQDADQELRRGNLALTRNEAEGVPVRVVRRVNSSQGRYRYDGLFHVTSSNFMMGRSGFHVWRYRLEAVKPTAQTAQQSTPLGSAAAIKDLLDQIDNALRESDWDTIHSRAMEVLVLVPDHKDAREFLIASERRRAMPMAPIVVQLEEKGRSEPAGDPTVESTEPEQRDSFVQRVVRWCVRLIRR